MNYFQIKQDINILKNPAEILFYTLFVDNILLKKTWPGNNKQKICWHILADVLLPGDPIQALNAGYRDDARVNLLPA